MAKNKKSNEIKIKVKGGGNSIFSSLLVKILIFIMVAAFALSAMCNCGSGCGGNGLFKAPSWLENILPERPDWLPDWFPSLFEKEEEIDGGNGDEPSDCEHIDENDDGVCDKCEARLEVENLRYTITFDPNGGELTVDYTTKQTNENGTLSGLPGAYREGYKFICWSISIIGDEPVTLQTVYYCDTTLYAQYDEACQHCDENYDEYCDICGVKYYCLHIDEDGDAICDKCEFEIPEDPNGGESSDCEHIDENADSFCDECGAILGDVDEPAPEPDPEPECEHRDEDDDGLCDKCSETFSDGNESDPEPECEHRDEDDDGLCDKCSESFSDGDEPECEHLDEDYSGFCDHCGGYMADYDYDSDEIVEENYKEFDTGSGRYPVYNPSAPLITEGTLYDEVQLPDDGYIYFILVLPDGFTPQPYVLRFWDNTAYFHTLPGGESSWEAWATKDCKKAAEEAGVGPKIDNLGNIWYAAGHRGTPTDPFYVSVINGRIYFAFSTADGWDFYTIEGVYTESSRPQQKHVGNHAYCLVATDSCPINELIDYVETDNQST